jgi:hypothetical protein
MPAIASGLMLIMGLVVISNPRLYERNIRTILLLSLAWILEEVTNLSVIKGFIIALLQGEACHLVLLSFNLSTITTSPTINIFWITIFILLQDDVIGICRLVAALALASYSFTSVYNRALLDGIHARSQREYWEWLSVADRRRQQQEQQQLARATSVPRLLRRGLGTYGQLLFTKRLYEMLSRTSAGEVEEAKQQFLQAAANPLQPEEERLCRDRFTIAVLAALSKQSTVQVIRSAESSNVARLASKVATFVERKFTASALNRIETLFVRLPILDPAEGNTWQTVLLLFSTLLGHKRFFKFLKQQRDWHKGHTTSLTILFLAKQTTRFFLVTYLFVRYMLGYLKSPPGHSLITSSLTNLPTTAANTSPFSLTTPRGDINSTTQAALTARGQITVLPFTLDSNSQRVNNQNDHTPSVDPIQQHPLLPALHLS